MLSDDNSAQVLNIIESTLELAGKGSKQVILDYLNVRYGMNMKLIAQYKDEFENYLRETLGDSAEIIISKINSNLYASDNDNSRHANGVTALHEQKVSHNTARSGNSSNISSDKRITKTAHFLICDSCFWCASIFDEHYEPRCLACGSRILSAVPVMHNEKFIVEVDKKRGISLSFH
jgi:hypothetical protein